MSNERVSAMVQAFRKGWADPEPGDIWGLSLAAADAVMFSDDALDLTAKVILEEVEPGFNWATANSEHRELYREVARAVFSSLKATA